MPVVSSDSSSSSPSYTPEHHGYTLSNPRNATAIISITSLTHLHPFLALSHMLINTSPQNWTPEIDRKVSQSIHIQQPRPKPQSSHHNPPSNLILSQLTPRRSSSSASSTPSQIKMSTPMISRNSFPVRPRIPLRHIFYLIPYTQAPPPPP